ncbi:MULTISPECIES: SHOCT domain-containing protein [unclassified Streptomyces]|uniref:SHOCT domain-containing protein n=1 Tax=unclassified Streptomyces TaxID=2593676 RepID=UPI000692260E|nr:MULTISPECIES: SHOCT domain-containing protein [unclassified Streptomyces]
MFIRPMGVTVHAANRPPGHPLLRGLLARASGAAEATTGSVGAPGPATSGSADRAEPPVGVAVEAPVGAPPEPPRPAEPEPAAAFAADHPAPAGLVAELTQLAGLAREGLLTPQEFTTAKARLLRG